MATLPLWPALAVLAASALACTNILVTPGASKDGSAFITYNADWDGFYGQMYHAPHATWPENATVQVVDWESTQSGDPKDEQVLGRIPQVRETFNVVGNMNEHGLAIGETTFFGARELSRQPGAIIDYGSLIYLTLQRARTAREAIAVIDSLLQQYGYASAGETFSISDGSEVWIMELIGRGSFGLGALWVAGRVPDGYVCAHANQARIRTWPRDDPDNWLWSADVVEFAKAHGFYPRDAPDKDFSFSDAFCPVTARNARADEARVWSVFRHVAGPEAMDPYTDYILGHNVSHRMPLWVRPTRRLSLNDTMMLMRDHYEGTVLDLRSDVGAQAFGMPYRWHPLTWQYGGRTYFNERTIATQQTAWTMVAQTRSWLPSQLRGILWFGMDDSSCTVYFPAYGASAGIPSAYHGGSMFEADLERAFWTFNFVANMAYSRWSAIYPDVFAEIQKHEARFIAEVKEIDAKAGTILKTSAEDAVAILTQYTVSSGQELQKEWLKFFLLLQAKFRDGNIVVRSARRGMFRPQFPGYSDAWKKRIVEEDGDRYIAI